MLESLNIKENVNVKAKGRSQPLRVHVVIFARLLKLILLIAFHYSSTETTDSLYELHPHQKKNKMQEGTNTNTIFNSINSFISL